MILKIPDLVGFVSVFTAGWYTGQNSDGWQWYDYVVVLGLLVIGFYFAVVLS